MKRIILNSLIAGFVYLLTFTTNAIAQSLPSDTTLSGLFNAIKSDVDPERMELMLKMMRTKIDVGNNQTLIDAGCEYTAIAYAEAGNAAKANLLISQIKETNWKNGTILAVVQKLIEAGKLDDAERMITAIVDASPNGIADTSFSEQEKQQLRFQRGTIRFRQGKYKEALPYLAPVGGKQRTKNSELYVLALMRSGNTDLALTEINKLLTRPGYFGAEFKEGVKTLFAKKYGSNQRFKTVMDSIDAAQAQQMRVAVEKMKVNEQAPDFEIKDVNGKLVSLKSLKGKTIIIDFWATWCIPCVGSFPGMQKAVDYYKGDSSVVFMFVHTSEKVPTATQDAMKIIDNKRYTFDVYMDLRDEQTHRNPMSSAFQVRGLPTKVVIDKNGMIRFRNTGYIGVDEAIPEISTMVEMSKLQPAASK
ncbi:redoxin domain-containing protein [Pedobacter sp. MC2016-14]|uniref:redoxin domain-containing protein n=1 Tax=Pedobacter sp. MC2016-14 TaxID=2897327 RepID=UPI001E48C2BB|nr:redoxin domain-containing protein [Pedobacter sp. MC2016-14]MCD0489148.1 redoxin domain-containing protein [Pedobacter sp. MC2016-14]